MNIPIGVWMRWQACCGCNWGAPVHNDTGLRGSYDLELKWSKRSLPHWRSSGLRRKPSILTHNGLAAGELPIIRINTPEPARVPIGRPCGFRQALNICREALFLLVWHSLVAHGSNLALKFFLEQMVGRG